MSHGKQALRLGEMLTLKRQFKKADSNLFELLF
jgi:hypothetical protein